MKHESSMIRQVDCNVTGNKNYEEIRIASCSAKVIKYREP